MHLPALPSNRPQKKEIKRLSGPAMAKRETIGLSRLLGPMTNPVRVPPPWIVTFLTQRASGLALPLLPKLNGKRRKPRKTFRWRQATTDDAGSLLKLTITGIVAQLSCTEHQPAARQCMCNRTKMTMGRGLRRQRKRRTLTVLLSKSINLNSDKQGRISAPLTQKQI